MEARSEALRAVGDLAMEQWGLVTTAQARKAGLSSQQVARMADAGALERIRHGVYRVAGAPDHRHEHLRAAWLAFDPSPTARERLAVAGVEVVSHRSAALMHGLGDLDADRLEFTTGDRKQSRDPQVRVRRRRHPPDWTLVDGLPTTTLLATIQDLAESHLDGGHLAGVVRDAVTIHHLDLADVATVLSPYAHHYGAPLGQGAVLLKQMLEKVGLPESTLAVGRLFEPYRLSESIQDILDKAAAAGIEPIRGSLAQAIAISMEPVERAVNQRIVAAVEQAVARSRPQPGDQEDV